MFEEPFILNPKEMKPEDVHPLEALFAGMVSANKNAVFNKRTGCTTYMKKKGVDQCMATLRYAEDVRIPSDAVSPFDQIASLKMVVWCKTTYTFDSWSDAHPYITASYFLTQFSMSSVIVFIDPLTVSKVGNLNEWLEQVDSDTLMGFRSVYLHEGATVYVPLGWVPVVLTLPGNVDYSQASPQLPPAPKPGVLQTHLGFYGITFCFSKDLAIAASDQARSVAHSQCILNRGAWHEAINTEAVGAYYDAVKVQSKGAKDDADGDTTVPFAPEAEL